jgi:SAM-dependent methyltransferase
MLGDARAEYVCDVPYPRKYVAQIAPPMLRLVAALNGVQAPPEEDFDYCELGSANGDSLALFAGANPAARFVGVDVNPDHVASSRRLAERAALENVRFFERDFEGFEREDLPEFDFIVAHGILSWVSPAKRDAALAFAAAKLKPGGLLYLSYDALPGWASVEPLRRLMLDHTAKSPGGSLERARDGVAFLQRLADSGAGYFAQHPTARSMLALMQTAGLPYVVHEYLHAHHHPMYFADLAQIVAAHGFGFVGQVPLHLNVRELATPPSIRKIAESVQDRAEFEMLKDFTAHELFRSDVYARAPGGSGGIPPTGRVVRSGKEMRFYFEGTPFGTMTTSAQIKRDPKLPFYTLDFKGPAYDAILDAIADAPATAMELAQREGLSRLGQARIGDCFRNLVLGGQVVPMRPGGDGRGESKLRVALAFNEAALDDALTGHGPLVLASPATGAGLHLSLLEVIALHLLTRVELAGHAAWLRDFAKRRGAPLVVGQRKIKDGDELVKVMPRELDRLRAALPRLARLGIVSGVA